LEEKSEKEIQKILALLGENDRALLTSLTKEKKELFQLGLQRDAALRSAAILEKYSLARVEKVEDERYVLTDEGKGYLKELLPEQRVVREAKVESLSELEKKVGIPWAIKNGWIEIKSGKIFPKVPQEKVRDYPLYLLLKRINTGAAAHEGELEILLKRGLAEKKLEKKFFISATDLGELAKVQLGQIPEMQTELTREIILSGKEFLFKPYDVEAPVEKPARGKLHPITLFIQKIKRIFLSMGFEEMSGPEIESTFWNFDALFQPQDHPARDVVDTFYLSDPRYLEVPDDVMQKVKESHEKNLKYMWDAESAKVAILRSHTTSVSARTLYAIGKAQKKPGKYFCIGRVYRNEAIDFSHLPEFHQVEGIVVWEGANFRHLLGLLKEFYRKLGFKKIKFVPHHFPYTEPSLEIHVYFEQKKKWFELGGAGIFRPELTIPLWGKYPVLAWGLSLERPMMALYDIQDIRTFYTNDLSWIEKTKM
jgi:phenylalanyl-tRNA synthetase alpha chain